MFQMQHLVINDVLEHVPRYRRVIKDTADDDSVVGRIVVPKNSARLGLAPAHAWPRHQPVKEARVEIFKDRIQIEKMPTRRTQLLAPPHLTDEMCLAYDLVTRNVFPVARGLPAIDWLPVHLGQQNMRDG